MGGQTQGLGAAEASGDEVVVAPLAGCVAVGAVVDVVEDDEPDDVVLVVLVPPPALPDFGFGLAFVPGTVVVVVVVVVTDVPSAFNTSCAELIWSAMAEISCWYCARFPACSAACAAL